MIQGGLWPLQIVRTEPAHFGTADCKTIGLGDDGAAYIIKRISDGQHVPISEFLCTQLAGAIGMAVPPCTVAQMPGDTQELCFASREESGVATAQQNMQMLTNAAVLDDFAERLMQWYTFDLFTHNVDRHVGNYLIRRSMLGPMLMGMDFSRALITQDWPNKAPPLPKCNTTDTVHALQMLTKYPTGAAAHTLTRLANIPDEWLNNHLQHIPAAWLSDTLRHDLCRWWRRGRSRRLKLLRRHLTSGRYLHLLAHPRRT